METKNIAEVSVRGNLTSVKSIHVNGRTIVVIGRFLRIAKPFDEEFMEEGTMTDPHVETSALKEAGIRADIFTFSEKLGEVNQKCPYYCEWDNVAAVNTTDFNAWWNQLPQESRKNVRKAARQGVVVQSVRFDDSFLQEIKALYDETPIRQGRKFWHFGKDLETIKRENGTYLSRSEFIGAYYKGELIGFMKFVRVGSVATMMQILSKRAHYDKRPMNALIAKAVEICQGENLSYLVYGKYAYGNKIESQLAEFKRRNGFVQMNFPRYFIPLTVKGKLALRFKLHLGLLGVLPAWLIGWILKVRSRALSVYYRYNISASGKSANHEV